MLWFTQCCLLCELILGKCKRCFSMDILKITKNLNERVKCVANANTKKRETGFYSVKNKRGEVRFNRVTKKGRRVATCTVT